MNKILLVASLKIVFLCGFLPTNLIASPSSIEAFLYDGTQTIQITENDKEEYFPALNDLNQLVWYACDVEEIYSDCRNGDYEIYLYDGSGIIQITDNNYDDNVIKDSPNGSFAWYGYPPDGQGQEIFYYNGTGTIRLTDNDFQERWPVLNDVGQLVWCVQSLGTGDIFLYDGTTTLHIGSGPAQYPYLNNNGHVVWVDWVGPPGSDLEIFYYDGTSTIQITDNDYDDEGPLINDNEQIVWSSEEGLFLYNGTDIIKLTDYNFNNMGLYPLGYPKDFFPYAINNLDHVAWTGSPLDPDNDIFLYNGSETIQLNNNTGTIIFFTLNEMGQVIWEGPDAESSQNLFFYDGTTVIQVTNNDYTFRNSKLNNIGQVVWWENDKVYIYNDGIITQLNNDSSDGLFFLSLNNNGYVAWTSAYCHDNDEDGYGNPAYSGCTYDLEDCDDTDPMINPGGLEICTDGRDNDCNDLTDYEDGGCPCLDIDGDGYGKPSNPTCTYSEQDCNDSNPDVNPVGTEGPLGDATCSDTLDNDCDGDVDAFDSMCSECLDNDGDGFGTSGIGNCPHPEPDCNDANSEVYPGRNEVRNNFLDDDCNSETIDHTTPFYRCTYSMPTLLAQVDLNGDGDLELAATTIPNFDWRIPQGTLELFNNQGKGTMPFGGTSLLSITFGDLNGDNYQDFITFAYDFFDYSITVGYGNGNGTFSDWAMYTLVEDAEYTTVGNMELGDLDNDNDLDLVVASVEGIYILINNGDGTFQDPATLPYYICALGDLDDNGNIDILTSGTGQEALVLFGNGDGTFQSPISYNVGEGFFTGKPGDVNGDGDLDLILLHYGFDDTPGSISIMLNDGSGNFLSPTNFPTGNGSNVMDTGDLNGDSHLDIALNNYEDKNIAILYGNGDGTFQTPVYYAPGYNPLSLDIGDQDGDGDLDIAISDAGDLSTMGYDDPFSGPKGLIYMLFNNGDGTFSPPPSSISSPWGAASVVGMEHKSISEVMNHLLMLLVPMGILVFWRAGGRLRK